LPKEIDFGFPNYIRVERPLWPLIGLPSDGLD